MRIQHFPHKHRKNANVRHKTKIATHLLNAVVITSKRYGMMNMNLRKGVQLGWDVAQ